MKLAVLLWLSSPITWVIAMMIVSAWSRLFSRADKKRKRPSGIARVGGGSSQGAASLLLFLSMAYRPNHAFIAKAQIQQQEDADDDDPGGPGTPRKHLLRQLRRIRRGAPLERLVLRLE